MTCYGLVVHEIHESQFDSSLSLAQCPSLVCQMQELLFLMIVGSMQCLWRWHLFHCTVEQRHDTTFIHFFLYLFQTHEAYSIHLTAWCSVDVCEVKASSFFVFLFFFPSYLKLRVSSFSPSCSKDKSITPPHLPTHAHTHKIKLGSCWLVWVGGLMLLFWRIWLQ